MRAKLLTDIFDDGQDHHPPGYIGHKGDEVLIKKVISATVHHESVTNNAFLVFEDEIELTTWFITECCNRVILSTTRFCPACGWECRVKSLTEGMEVKSV